VIELQRMAGNRAVTALIARDPKPKTPAKAPPPKKKELPKQSYVAIEGMDPIVFESAQFGQTRSIRGHAGESKEKEKTPEVAEINITTLMGDHSDALFQQSLYGKPFSAEIVFQKDGVPYMKIKLKDVLISSYTVSGHGGGVDSKPMEAWTLNATKIEYETFGGGTAAPPG
jgi:type VI protein secretion system component Hcp